MTDAESEVVRMAGVRRKYAFKKQNNKKRDPTTLYKSTDQPARCEACYQKSQVSGVSVPEIVNDASGDCVCGGCGLVLSRTAALGTDFSDFGRVCPTAKARTRENYMRERMSQWNLSEPPIPMVDREKLRAAYNGGYGGRDPSSGELEFDPALQKQTVRLIIIRAGLSTKKYTEKWLTIRKMLGAAPHPLPTADLIGFILERFTRIVSIWQRYGKSLCPPGHERKSLFNYNYMIQQLLLLHSIDAYNTHVAWFPVQASQKVVAMDAMWRALCAYAEWPCYHPIWQGDDKVIGRRIDVTLPTIQKRVVKRRRLDVPVLSQTTLPFSRAESKQS